MAVVVFFALLALHTVHLGRGRPVPTWNGTLELRRKLNWCGPSHEVGALPGLDDRGCVKNVPSGFRQGFRLPGDVWRHYRPRVCASTCQYFARGR